MHQEHFEHVNPSTVLSAAFIAGILCLFASLTAIMACVMAALRGN